jgi:hypothetical protein
MYAPIAYIDNESRLVKTTIHRGKFSKVFIFFRLNHLIIKFGSAEVLNFNGESRHI